MAISGAVWVAAGDILDSVYTELPDPPYSPADKQALAASVYRHIWQQSVGAQAVQQALPW